MVYESFTSLFATIHLSFICSTLLLIGHLTIGHIFGHKEIPFNCLQFIFAKLFSVPSCFYHKHSDRRLFALVLKRRRQDI